MPVQINELVIRANVVESGDKAKEAQPKASKGSGDADKSEIVRECVDMVLEVLNNKIHR